MTREQLKAKFPNACESFLRLNSSDALGPVADPKREPDKRGEGKDRGLVGGQARVGYCVTIVSFRRRLVDAHDNLRTGAKPLVDRITETLGFRSDDDPALTWQYVQLRTAGPEGTLVVVDYARAGAA